MKKIIPIIVVIIIILGGGFYLYKNFAPTNTDELINSVVFNCADQKSIKAKFYKSRVAIVLSDGRSRSLPQVISASGARYANKDESFVFWNKGDTAFINENNEETFKDCVINNPIMQSVKNNAYIVDGKSVTLVNGLSETEIVPGSTSKTITKYFGNEKIGDVNGDGKDDVVFLLTQENGGSGTFYYVATLLSDGDDYKGTNAILLGDRIAPQTTEINDGVITINYADRNANEPFTTPPSVGVSKYFKIIDNTLTETILSIEYNNESYGFTFTLPKSWTNYSIINGKWTGNYFNTDGSQSTKVEEGPLISIRHPGWTKDIPRQDIPIMVFTNAQWSLLQQDKIHIGAAPINPSELGHNANYVFALPARYNFAFPVGFEEVEAILKTNPLQTTK